MTLEYLVTQKTMFFSIVLYLLANYNRNKITVQIYSRCVKLATIKPNYRNALGQK